MANYYDKVLEDFDFNKESEGVFDESFDDSYDGESFDESSRDHRNKSRPRVPSSIGQPSNFGRGISSPSQGNFVTKAELRSSLNSISNQVNDLKKSNLSLVSSIKRLDDSYSSAIKSIAKKSHTKDNATINANMMSMMVNLLSPPQFDPKQLHANEKGEITLKAGGVDPVSINPITTMLPMLLGMGSSSGDDSNTNMMMPLMLLLLLPQSGGTTGTGVTGTTNTTMLMVVMMMMMNKK